MKANPHVAGLLLGQGMDLLPQLTSYAYGDESEAWFCAALLADAWERRMEALEWLEEVQERAASPRKR